MASSTTADVISDARKYLHCQREDDEAVTYEIKQHILILRPHDSFESQISELAIFIQTTFGIIDRRRGNIRKHQDRFRESIDCLTYLTQIANDDLQAGDLELAAYQYEYYNNYFTWLFTDCRNLAEEIFFLRYNAVTIYQSVNAFAGELCKRGDKNVAFIDNMRKVILDMSEKTATIDASMKSLVGLFDKLFALRNDQCNMSAFLKKNRTALTPRERLLRRADITSTIQSTKKRIGCAKLAMIVVECIVGPIVEFMCELIDTIDEFDHE